MKTSPLLLGATLAFWGWQSGHWVEGVVMAVVLEGARVIRVRWDFTDEDFRRIWTFCALVMLATALYAFTATGGPGDLQGFFQNPSLANQRNVGNASARTIAALIRWLPMIFFLFVAAQAYNSRDGVPAETISLILRLRWQRARRLGQRLPAARSVDVTYPYLMLCLVAASFHASDDQSFYWGLCALLAWALWPQRSRRYGVAVWAGAFAAAIVLGFSGQQSVGRLYRWLEYYNAQWFVRTMGRSTNPLQSKTSLGHIGWLKGSGKIVIRLEPGEGSRAPALLREASYRTWRAQSWLSEVTRDRFENVFEGTNHTTWELLPGKANSASVKIACYLPGRIALLPLPAGSGRLENLSAYVVQKNDLGAVLAEGPGLVVFDALYGPGHTLDSPGNTNEDLAVPPREVPALEQVIAELQLQHQSRKQALRTLGSFFQDSGKFSYGTWQGLRRFKGTNETPLSRFLLRTRKGHCEYFATATVLLLRQIGIPARYAIGYAVHEATGRNYVVRQRDAHAWCLVWNPATGTWQDFDTTPASWVAAEGKRASPMQFLSDAWSRLVFEFAKFRWGQTHLRQYLLWGLVPVLALLLYQIIFRSRRRRAGGPERPGATAIWPGLDSEFYQVEKKLVERGAVRQPGEPLSVWLQRSSTDPALAEERRRLLELLGLHYRYRFDPQGLNGDERAALRREASGCLARLA